jgi:HAD superfamily hydrolase (TIGR01509 family)
MTGLQSALDLSEVDTYLFDYGGVVAFHYCEPWQGNLSTLLKVSPRRVRGLLSETSEQGREYRIGKMSREDFWDQVMNLAGCAHVDMRELEENWARSYQLDYRMLGLIEELRKARKKVGIIMNTDAYRHAHIEKEYNLSDQVDVIISSCIHGIVKPEIDAYKCALDIVDRSTCPEKTLYIDDRERNIDPCLQIGMKGAVFSNFESFKNGLIAANIFPQF